LEFRDECLGFRVYELDPYEDDGMWGGRGEGTAAGMRDRDRKRGSMQGVRSRLNLVANVMRWSCSVLQCVTVRGSVLQCVAVCCSVLQCVAVCCSVLQRVALCCTVLHCVALCYTVLHCVALCCSVM